MMITLAKPSIAESSPKPTNAIEPATRPATIATAPSAVIQTSDSHDSSLTRPGSSSYRSRVIVATGRASPSAVVAGAPATTWTFLLVDVLAHGFEISEEAVTRV